MDMDMQAYGLLVIPVIVGLVEMVKRLGMPDRLAPLVAVLLGVPSGMIWIAPDDWRAGLLVGIVMGLSSVGLYSSGRNTVEAVRER